MNAIDLLKQQHREVEKLFAQFEAAETEDKKEIFNQIADALAVHATIEEKQFYPAAKSHKTEDILLESLEEHLGVKRIIADCLDADATDETFEAKVKVLKEQVEHHVGEEENQLFPMVQRQLGSRKLDALGEAMEAEAADLLVEGAPRLAVPSETAEAHPLE